LKILVTGGAGYIGSHVVQTLIEQKHNVFVLDNLSTGARAAVPEGAAFFEADILNGDNTEKILRDNKIEAVMHFAAKLIVPESISNPEEYYRTNVVGGLQTVQACLRAGVKNFIFSSTAAVYGASDDPVTEFSATQPMNPYGTSKLMMERILADMGRAYPKFKWLALRYFNVAGAAASGANGPRMKNATHLIKVAAEAAVGLRPQVHIFGTDYDTTDGTCVRDYIHVEDLADAHVAALNGLVAGKAENEIFNCGYGRGATVREVISAMKEVSGKNFSAVEVERRAGDPSVVVADATKLRSRLGWLPKNESLKTICKSAYEWERSQQ
jgi:UDP-glucose 4-epimerase